MILASRLAAAFFVLAPRILAPHVEGPPVAAAVGFPAVVFGVAARFRCFVSYFAVEIEMSGKGEPEALPQQ
jgi:hypothetical protein